MSSNGTGYDLSVTTFSPDGRVSKIEYFFKAVDHSGTLIGTKYKDCFMMVPDEFLEQAEEAPKAALEEMDSD